MKKIFDWLRKNFKYLAGLAALMAAIYFINYARTKLQKPPLSQSVIDKLKSMPKREKEAFEAYLKRLSESVIAAEAQSPSAAVDEFEENFGG